MIQDERQCVDVVQQVNAVVAAFLGTHLQVCVTGVPPLTDGRNLPGEIVSILRQDVQKPASLSSPRNRVTYRPVGTLARHVLRTSIWL